jgi:phage FluMu protein Com
MASSNKKYYLPAVLTNKCPRCREGNIFKSQEAYKFKTNTDMHENCPVCGQPTEIEVGFYYGTGYVSYALSVAFIVSTFVAWKVLIGMTFDIDDNRIFYWMGTAFVLLFSVQPLLMRLSRSLWLSWFVSYDPEWKNNPLEMPERVVPEQKNNW